MHGILVLSLGCTVTPGELSKILLSSNTRNYDLITWGMVLGERMFKISTPPTPCQPGNFTLQPRLRPVCSMCMRAQLCLALCNLMDCSLSGSSIHGISQARILECVAISSPRGSWPRDRTRVSCIAGGFLTIYCATWESLHCSIRLSKLMVLHYLHYKYLLVVKCDVPISDTIHLKRFHGPNNDYSLSSK